jgi:hypothetical protein
MAALSAAFRKIPLEIWMERTEVTSKSAAPRQKSERRGVGTRLGKVGIGDFLYLASAFSEHTDMAAGRGKR